MHSGEHENERHSHVNLPSALVMCQVKTGIIQSSPRPHTQDKEELLFWGLSGLTLSQLSPIQFDRNTGCLGTDENFNNVPLAVGREILVQI